MADDSAALMERLEAWAAKERHNARHVSGPAFHPPWGQDIIDRHNQNAADLTLALSLLADRARMEKALREIADAHGAVQPVGAGDGSTFIVNDHVAARNMRKIAREGLGVSQ